MDEALHRIEALPGDGRYAVTFRRGDGAEQTAVVQVRDELDAVAGRATVEVAEASLPAGWTRDGGPFAETASAVLAMHRSRALSAPRAGVLRDPDGGWDVSLGNVVLDDAGRPSCIAHGEMQGDGAGRWVCPDCGAQALFGG